jgi:hypothetical protein
MHWHSWEHKEHNVRTGRGPAGEHVFDLYYDAISNLWVLDVAHD